MKHKSYYYFILILGMLCSCARDVEEDLYPCTNIQEIRYSDEIVPILSQNCYLCHSQQSAPGVSNIVLEGYSNLMVKVNDGKLICSIKHQSCATAMPFGRDKLDACLIKKIETWVNEGAQNN